MARVSSYQCPVDERERSAVARALGAQGIPTLEPPSAAARAGAYVDGLGLESQEHARLVRTLAQAIGPVRGRVRAAPFDVSLISRHRLDFVAFVTAHGPLDASDVHARLDLELACLAPAPAAGLFASGVAHDLRNPLGVIRTAVFLARREQDPDKRNRQLDKILRQVDEATQLASDLLALVREGPLDRSVIELDAGLQDLMTESTEVDIPDGLHLRAHRTLLRRAVVNLIDNARAFARSRHGIRATAVEGGHEIEVWDDGPGFDDPHAAFDAFVSDRPGGTGLGLWLVAEIARRHGGTASAQNDPDHDPPGTRVRITIPHEAQDN